MSEQETSDDIAEDTSALLHRITHPIVCAKCSEEVLQGLSNGLSMQDYAALDIGFTDVGIQVWCRRHNINVCHVDFQGNRLPADFRCFEIEPTQ